MLYVEEHAWKPEEKVKPLKVTEMQQRGQKYKHRPSSKNHLAHITRWNFKRLKGSNYYDHGSFCPSLPWSTESLLRAE